VETGLRLVSYTPGRIAFEPTPAAPEDLAPRLAGRLQGWTGVRWVVSVAQGGAPTIAETRDAAARAAETEAQAHPFTRAVLDAFPGAKVVEIRSRAAAAYAAAAEALEEVEDEWDPFDEG
jgi:DNA polymerase-3 subunit gamma/tau